MRERGCLLEFYSFRSSARGRVASRAPHAAPAPLAALLLLTGRHVALPRYPRRGYAHTVPRHPLQVPSCSNCLPAKMFWGARTLRGSVAPGLCASHAMHTPRAAPDLHSRADAAARAEHRAERAEARQHMAAAMDLARVRLRAVPSGKLCIAITPNTTTPGHTHARRGTWLAPWCTRRAPARRTRAPCRRAWQQM